MNQSENSGEQAEESIINNTRRQFVAGSAGAIGGLGVGSALSGSVLAQEDDEVDEEEEEIDEEEEEGGMDEFEDDVDILNYALKIEYLEARFYEQGLENISEEAFCNCEALSEDGNLRDRVYDELMTIQEHEESHVETLESTIESLGGTPIEEPEFDFGLAVEYPMAFLGTAAQLEDVGVSAYAGAAPSIENEDLVVPALGIHSVEARHAAFLRTLTSQTSFPEVIDEPRSRSEVLDLAGEFIVDEDGDMDDMDDDEDDPDDDEETEEPTDDDPDDDDVGNGDDDDVGNGDDDVGNGDDDDAGNGDDDDAGNGDDDVGNGDDDDAGNGDDDVGNGDDDDVGNGTDNGTDDGI